MHNDLFNMNQYAIIKEKNCNLIKQYKFQLFPPLLFSVKN
jgi:hypothetical protein